MLTIRQIVENYEIRLPSNISIPSTITGIEELIQYLNKLASPVIDGHSMIDFSEIREIKTIIEKIESNREFLEEAMLQNLQNEFQTEPSQSSSAVVSTEPGPSTETSPIVVSSEPSSSAVANTKTKNEVVSEMTIKLICPLVYMEFRQEKKELTIENTFKDPVTTPNGFTYERENLLAYLAKNNNLTPNGEIITNSDTQLYPNLFIKSAAEHFRYDQTIREEDRICPISQEPLTSNVRQTPAGQSFQQADIEGAIDYKASCPFSRNPLSKQQLRPNLRLEEVCRLYANNISLFEQKSANSAIEKVSVTVNADTDDFLIMVFLRDAVNRLRSLINRFPLHHLDDPQKKTKDSLTDIYNVLNNLYQNSKNLDNIKLVMNSLEYLHHCYLDPKYKVSLQDCGISSEQFVDVLSRAFISLTDLLELKKEAIDNIAPAKPGRANDYKNKCQKFLARLNLRSEMYDRAKPLIFGKADLSKKYIDLKLQQANNTYSIEITFNSNQAQSILSALNNIVIKKKKLADQVLRITNEANKITFNMNAEGLALIIAELRKISYISLEEFREITQSNKLDQETIYRILLETPSSNVNESGVVAGGVFSGKRGKDKEVVVDRLPAEQRTIRFPPEDKTKELKIVAVGDSSVGKTCMLITYYNGGEFPSNRMPRFRDHYDVNILINDHHVMALQTHDTAGQEEYSRLRPLVYPGTDVFLLLYSVVQPSSFKNIENWVVELRYHVPNAPIILVGSKIDLRQHPETIEELRKRGEQAITTEQGKELAKEIKADAFLEISSLKNHNIQRLFEQAISSACWAKHEAVREHAKANEKGKGIIAKVFKR